MSQEKFFVQTRAQFRIVGPSISKDGIYSVFPDPFPGRDDLVQFYLHHNGGSRSEQGGLVHCGNPSHRVSRDNLERIKIERFYSIPHNPEDKMHPLTSMLRHYSSKLHTFEKIPEMLSFLEGHRPIASDHTGNDCWIDIRRGSIQFILRGSWKEGPIEIASSFREFVEEFWNITPDRIPKFEPPCGLNTVEQLNWVPKDRLLS
jgi:hypothetical protein